MMKKHYALLAVVLFSSLVGGSAWAEPALTLKDFLDAVREKSPDIASSERWYEASRLRIRRAKALPDPEVTVMGENLSLEGEESPMLRLQAGQMVPWPGKRGAMAKVAEREAEAAGARSGVVRLDALTAARRVYYQLYLNSSLRTLNREQYELVKTLVEIAIGQVKAGMSMHHDVLKMQTEATMLDDELVMLEADRREMVAMANALLGRTEQAALGEPLEAWSPTRPLDREALLASALERRPELKEMGSMKAAEEAMAEVARREVYPDVMFGFFYDSFRDEPDMFGVMATMNVPLWAGSKQRLDQRAAELRAASLEKKREGMAAMTASELDQAIARVEAAERRIKLIEESFLPLAQQTFEAGLATYPTGKTSVLEVLDALRVLNEQKRSLVTLRVERELALADLDRSLGLEAGARGLPEQP
jgi:outer membrane protein, heavy metal efflux system